MPRATKPKLHAVSTNLIMGFLGVGKTTAILNLLENKPRNEKWAILVNEFGSVGIDGAIYSTKGAIVKEVPGGCMCCAVGLPMQVAVNRLLRAVKPDRLLIEPSGLGHPRRILDTLSTDHFKDVLKIQASVCLVDPRKFNDVRYTNNENFVDQIALCDILVANKMDLADSQSVQRFLDWAAVSPTPKSVIAQSTNGKINADWLDIPRNPHREATFPHAHVDSSSSTDKQEIKAHSHATSSRLENSGDGFHSCGWVFPKNITFDFRQLSDWLSRISPERMKGILATNRGWFLFNCSDGLMTITQVNSNQDNRVEFILPKAQWDAIETGLKSCIQL